MSTPNRHPVAHRTCHHRIYFLSCEDYERLLARAAGHCELCSRPASENFGGKLGIDHDHRIGWDAVRGLLCQKCNSHMYRIDAGLRPIDSRTAAYLALSGFVVPPAPPRVESRRRAPKAPQPPRHVIREFAAWYARVPGAKLPKRPAA